MAITLTPSPSGVRACDQPACAADAALAVGGGSALACCACCLDTAMCRHGKRWRGGITAATAAQRWRVARRVCCYGARSGVAAWRSAPAKTYGHNNMCGACVSSRRRRGSWGGPGWRGVCWPCLPRPSSELKQPMLCLQAQTTVSSGVKSKHPHLRFLLTSYHSNLLNILTMYVCYTMLYTFLLKEGNLPSLPTTIHFIS